MSKYTQFLQASKPVAVTAAKWAGSIFLFLVDVFCTAKPNKEEENVMDLPLYHSSIELGGFTNDVNKADCFIPVNKIKL